LAEEKKAGLWPGQKRWFIGGPKAQSRATIRTLPNIGSYYKGSYEGKGNRKEEEVGALLTKQQK
jgi:hypothetical protein